MSDSLTVFGVDYTGVTGIKAKGTGNGTLTYIRPTGTKSISANGTGIDVTEYASVDVAVSGGAFKVNFSVDNGTWSADKTFAEIQAAYSSGSEIVVTSSEPDATAQGYYDDNSESLFATITYYDYTAGHQVLQWLIYDASGVQDDGSVTYIIEPTEAISITSNGTHDVKNYATATVNVPSSAPSLQVKTATPTTSQQVITADSGYDGLSQVTVSAMPTGTAGTPTATKGTVSNHSVSVTPSVTNVTGYIEGGTKNGTAVSVSASELVSGTYTVSASGTHDVTNYASASVTSGGATASATKGSVSNHSVTVTPSVTRTAGYVTAGTANGTAVTVSASELVSGSQTLTDNGTVDVTNLASVTVDIDFVIYYVSSSDPTSSQGSDGDVWLVTA